MSWEDTIKPLVAPGAPTAPAAPDAAASPSAPKVGSWEDTIRPLGASLGGVSLVSPGGATKDVATGLAEGAKAALNPFAITPEEYHRQHSVTESAVSTLTNLAAGQGLASLVGGAVGTAVAGPLGTGPGILVGQLLYGVYEGIGKEYSRSAAEHQDFNPLRAAVNVGLSVNPLVKQADKLARIVRAGAQVAGAAGTEYSYTGSAQAAALAGAGTLLVAPLMYRGLRPTSVMPTAETAQTVLKVLSTEPGQDMLNRATTKLNALPELERTFEGIKDRPDFQAWVTNSAVFGEHTVDAFKDTTSKMSPKLLDDAAHMFQFRRSLLDSAAEVRGELADKIASGQFTDPFTPVVKYLQSARYAAREIDRVSGLNAEGLLDVFSNSRDLHNTVTAGYLARANAANKLTKTAGVTREDMGRWLSGRVEGLGEDTMQALRSDAGTKAADSWRSIFEDVRHQIGKAGYDVAYLGNYLPMKDLRGADLAFAIEDHIKSLTQQALGQGKRSFLAMADTQEYRDLVAVAQHQLGKTDVTSADLMTLSKSVLQRESTAGAPQISAMLERRGDMPDFVRQWDVGKLAEQYINGNLKAVHFADAFKQGNIMVETLGALGLSESAQYMERYLAHQAGTPGKVADLLWNTPMQQLRLSGLRMEAGGQETLGRLAQAAPNMAAWANQLFYPALLGLNVRTAVKTLAQPFTMTAPELGGTYGYALVAKSTILAARKSVTEGIHSLETELKDRGLWGNIVRTEFSADGPWILGTWRPQIDKINDLVMDLHTKAMLADRYVSVKAGELWAQDVAGGVPNAVQALKRLSTGRAAAIRAADFDLQTKEGVDGLARSLGEYLVGKTNLRYGKEQLSEFGRDFGKAFSMFTTVPVAVASDLVELAKRRQPLVAFTRYAAPYLALQSAGALVGESKDVPLYDYLVGDMVKLSPLDSLKTLESLMGSPGLKAVAGVGKMGVEFGEAIGRAGWEGAPEAAAKSLRRVVHAGLTQYAPVVSPVLNELDRLQKSGILDVGEAPSRSLTGALTPEP